LLVDTSVARNFAIAGWTDVLATLSQGTIRVAHGVLGLGPEEPGELDRARDFFERQTGRHPAGSPEYTHALVALRQLDDLISRRSIVVQVVTPTREELEVAIRLQAYGEREWRKGLGMRARRLDAGEAVSVAICVSRKEAFSSDDEDACIAYRALGGVESLSTLDLARRAVQMGLLPEDEARREYERLRSTYRFFGPPWPQGSLR
jgi:predicted nucleic acid-binding protein